MSTDTATRNNRSKRTRIDPTVRILQTEQAPPEPKAPKALAIAFVKSHSASLQPQVGSILERLGTQHLNLLSKHHQKTVQITKMEQNKDFIPRSARIEFSFHMTKEAMESPDFQTLQTNTEAKIQEFRHFLKRQIIDATKLEETVLLHQIQDDFIHALRHVIHTFLTANSVPITPTNLQATIKTIISDQLLFKHCKLTPETFVQRANTILPDLFDSPSQTTTEPMDHSDSLVIQGYTPYNPGLINPTGTNSPNQTVPLPVELNHITQTIKQAFKAIFVTAWDQFLDQVQKNRITHELSKLNTTVFDAPATEKAATILDNEVSADRATLDALIVEKTQAVTKQLTQQIKQLNDKLATLQKNNTTRSRGRSSSQNQNASTSTKRSSRSPRRHQSRQNNCPNPPPSSPSPSTTRHTNRNRQSPQNQKADDNNNTSRNDNRNTNRNNSRMNSQKRSRLSKMRQNNQSKRSDQN